MSNAWRQNIISLISLAVIVVWFVLMPEFASAQGIGGPPGSTGAQAPENTAGTFEQVAALLYALVVAVFGWLVYIGGAIMNIGITTYVFEFSAQYQSTFGFAIDYLWSVVRDLFNLLFIFGLIYIGFRLIFNSDDSRARSTLVSLILAALLVNFSLFISKAVVDFSNLTAYEISQGIGVLAAGGGDQDVSEQFMIILGIQEIFSIPSQAADAFAGFSTGGVFAYIFGIMFIFFIAAFVFAAGGILLMIRFVALCIFMVFSPLMFIGWVIPALSSYTSQWWRKFLGYAFMAPAYIFMIYMSLYVLRSLSISQGIRGNGLLEAFGQPGQASAGAGSVATLTFFLVAAGFLIASLIVARQMGAAGASMAIGIGNNLRQRGQRVMGGATLGLAARGGRATVGRAGNALAKSKSLARAGQGKGLQAWTARQAQSIGVGAAGSSFDARRVAGLGKQLNIGEGKKGGVTQILKDREKKEKDIANRMLADDQIYTDRGVKEIYDEYVQKTKERSDAFAELAAAKDKEAREFITLRIKNLNQEIAQFEKADTLGAENKPADVSMEKWSQMAEFALAKKSEKGYGKKLYAANLRSRYTDTLAGQWITSALFDSQLEREAAANAIEKEVGKDANEKLLDAIKDSGSSKKEE